jgi:glycosyltransferase involved in cell wall biosynthesis
MFSNYENFPCVIAESLMTGIPVISSNVNGIPEHVNSQNGILVEPRNEDQLEKAIVQFLNTEIVFNKDEIRQYAEAHFSYQSVGKSFDTVYRKVLAQN